MSPVPVPGAIDTAVVGIYPDKPTQPVLFSWPNEPSRLDCTAPTNPEHLLFTQTAQDKAANQHDAEVTTRITLFFRRRLECQAH